MVNLCNKHLEENCCICRPLKDFNDRDVCNSEPKIITAERIEKILMECAEAQDDESPKLMPCDFKEVSRDVVKLIKELIAENKKLGL